MVEQLEIKNLTYLKSVILNRTDADYLLDDDGIDWGSVPSQISSRNSISGLGSIVSNVTLTDPRLIHIVGWVIPGDNLTIEDKKEYLSKICNPIDPIRIYCGEYTIEGRVDSAVKFSTSMSENNEVMCKCSISIKCANPFFIRHIEKHFGANTENPIEVLHTSTNPEGIPYAVRSVPIPLENFGDFDVGAEFLLELSDSYKELYVSTRDPKTSLSSYFRFTGGLSEGSILRVNTATNEKYVSNYTYWDLDSDWVQVYRALDASSFEDWCGLTLEVYLTEESQSASFEGLTLKISYDALYLTMEDE